MFVAKEECSTEQYNYLSVNNELCTLKSSRIDFEVVRTSLGTIYVLAWYSTTWNLELIIFMYRLSALVMGIRYRL